MELQEYCGAGGRRCGSCEAAPAAVHCRTCVVASYLCTECDARPAHALLGHERVWMSELVPTAVACEAHGAGLCDADIHGANPLARVPIGSEEAMFGTGEAAAASEAEEQDVAAEQHALELDFLTSMRRLDELDTRLHGVGLAGAIVEVKSEAGRLGTVVTGVKGWAVENKPLADGVKNLKKLIKHAENVVHELEDLREKQVVSTYYSLKIEEFEDNSRKNRCNERDYFHITRAVNGEPAKAKCIDCGTQVVFSHGTSVLRKHRNSARCKNKRPAIEEEPEVPNYPSTNRFSTQNGVIISITASKGKGMIYEPSTTWKIEWVKSRFSKRTHQVALEFGCMQAILVLVQRGQLYSWIDRVGIACAFKALKAKVEGMEIILNGVNGRVVGNKPLQHQVQGAMLSPAIEPEGMDGEEDRDEANAVGASSSSSIPNKRGRKNRSEAWDVFELMPAVNGEAAKAKCVGCGTEVKCGHGTSVMHKHRNSDRCKRKCAAIEEMSDSSRKRARSGAGPSSEPN